MINEILENKNNPKILEKLYRSNKNLFVTSFSKINDEERENLWFQFWFERLKKEEINKETYFKKDLILILLLSLIATIIAKIPRFTPIDEEFFYSRNISFIIFPFFIFYTFYFKTFTKKKIGLILSLLVFSILYINLLPQNTENDSITIVFIHYPILIWFLYYLTYILDDINNLDLRIKFLKFNADLLIISGMILLCGLLFTGLTISLFNLIQINIEKFYFEYVAIYGLVTIPIVSIYLLNNNSQLVEKISSVIAKIFTPIVFITLLIYLFAFITSKKDIYNDREFLLIFDFLLVGVIALVFFSIVENNTNEHKKGKIILLLALSLLTIVINVFALSAIGYRIFNWGITPNRIVVLGSNLLFLIHLTLISKILFKTHNGVKNKSDIRHCTASFIPVYFIWIIFVVFLLPLLFLYK